MVVMRPWPRRSLTDWRSAPPASSQEAWAWRRSWVRIPVRVILGPGAPEMTLLGTRIYQFDDEGKIAEEQVVFFVAPD